MYLLVVSPVETARSSGAPTELNGKRLTEKQSARRLRVIQSAMALAAEGGYDAVQMRDVAARARVALGTLYRYFPSKDHLLVAAMGEWTKELQRRVSARPPRGATPAERVADVLRRAVRGLEREPKLAAAVVTALSTITSQDQATLADAKAIYGTIEEIIDSAIDHGVLEDHDTVIRILSHVWFSAVVAWVRGWGEDGEMARDLDAAARLLIRA